MRLTPIALVLLLLMPAAHAQECAPGRTPIMLLGTFHFTGGLEDTYQSAPENILGERRQKDVAELVERLARFRPTKVAIESAHYNTERNAQYRAYREGKRELGVNEIEQLGFRLAAKMNLERVTPVDYPMWMSGVTAQERRATPKPSPKPAPAPAPAPAAKDPVREYIDRQRELQRSSTLSEYLAYLNEPETYRVNHQWDVISNLRPGDGLLLYTNTDYATNWYKRNLRIVTNIIEATEPNDRILLIIGVGHLYVLNDLLSQHPAYCLVDPKPYLRAKVN